jgi:hypothetical protein
MKEKSQGVLEPQRVIGGSRAQISSGRTFRAQRVAGSRSSGVDAPDRRAPIGDKRLADRIKGPR